MRTRTIIHTTSIDGFDVNSDTTEHEKTGPMTVQDLIDLLELTDTGNRVDEVQIITMEEAREDNA